MSNLLRVFYYEPVDHPELDFNLCRLFAYVEPIGKYTSSLSFEPFEGFSSSFFFPNAKQKAFRFTCAEPFIYRANRYERPKAVKWQPKIHLTTLVIEQLKRIWIKQHQTKPNRTTSVHIFLESFFHFLFEFYIPEWIRWANTISELRSHWIKFQGTTQNIV